MKMQPSGVLAVRITHNVTLKLSACGPSVNPLSLGTFSAVINPLASGVLLTLLHASGARLDASHGEWRVPAASYGSLFRSLCMLHSVRVSPLPALVLHALDAGDGGVGGRPPAPGLLRTYPEGDAVPLRVPTSLMEKLRAFQVAGVRFAVARGGRALLGDEMGCGKTAQAVAFAAHYRDLWPLLILAPAALRLNWREELLKWLAPHITAEDITVVLKGKEKLPAPRGGGGGGTGGGFAAGVVIVSYSAIAAITASRAITPGFFKVVLADESHSLKTQTSARTRAVLPLLHAARHVLLLSGTPLPNRPRELYAQLSGVNRYLFPSYEEYARRYCAARQASWGWDDGGASNTEELRALMQLHALVRRTKAEVLRDLPPKTRSTTRVPITASAREQLGVLSKNFSEVKARLRALPPDDAAVDQLRLASRGLEMAIFKALGVGKAPAVVEHVFANVLEPLPGRNFFAVPESAVVVVGAGAGGGRGAAHKRRGGGGGGGGTRGGNLKAAVKPAAASEEGLTSDDDGGEGSAEAEDAAENPTAAKRARGGPNVGAARVAPGGGAASGGGGGSLLGGASLPCSGGGFFVGEGASPFPRLPFIFSTDALGGGGTRGGGGCGSGPSSRQTSIRDALVSPSLSLTQPRAEEGAALDAAAPPLPLPPPPPPPLPPPPAAAAAGALAKVTKLCLFAHHKDVLDILAAACLARGVRFVRVDGAADANAKHRACKLFAEDPGVQVALLAIMAAGVGLSFTAARRAVFAELQFTPGDIMQAEDRIHRLGQNHAAHVEYCVSEDVPGEFDQRLWALLEKKVTVITRALEAGDAPAAALAALRGRAAPPAMGGGDDDDGDDGEGGDDGERAKELPLDVSLFGDEEEEGEEGVAAAAPPPQPPRPAAPPLSDEALCALLDELEAPAAPPLAPPPPAPDAFWDNDSALLELLEKVETGSTAGNK